jgi:hypothetical protein
MCALLLAGCASMMPAPIEQIASLPVVTLGALPPSGSEYVLFIPAHSSVPVKLNINGTLLERSQTVAGNISFARDLYVYKYWASHDRKNWENSHKLLAVSYGGGMDISGLNANVTLDAK